MNRIMCIGIVSVGLLAACGGPVDGDDTAPVPQGQEEVAASADTVEHPTPDSSPTVGKVTFTFGSGPTAQQLLSCSVGYPYSTTTYSTRNIRWSASVSCNLQVEMQGTTVLYRWNDNWVIGYGSQYNAYTTSASSSGNTYVSGGTYGINHNVLITVPPGATTTVSGGCAWASSNQIKCTATTGPINMP